MTLQWNIVMAFFLATIFAISSSHSLSDNMSTIMEITPAPKSFSMQIQEFHECVSCHENDQARKDYDKCLKLLSEYNRDIIKSCCKPVFGMEFCEKGAAGNIQYSTICKDPKQALQVGKCFWQKTDNKNSTDIEKYRECKRQILADYCTTSHSDH